MHNVGDIGEQLGRALAMLPVEQLGTATTAVDDSKTAVYPVAAESYEAEPAEAHTRLKQATAAVDTALQACNTAREHLLTYLAGLGVERYGDAPPSLPHPSTYRSPVSDDPSETDRWVGQAQEKLPKRTTERDPTQGVLRVPGSGDIALRSGGRGRPIWNAGSERWEHRPVSDQETPEEREQRKRVSRIDVVLVGDPVFGKGRLRAGPPAVSQHVEAQAAMRMREAGVTHAAVAINNKMCSGEFSCEVAVRTILPRGSVLDVWEPGATRPRRIEGQA